MHDVTIHTIVVVILLSIIFAGVIAYFADDEKKFKYNILLSVLWLMGMFFLGIVLYIILFDISIENGDKSFFAPVGIILASFIASASMMKSIESSRTLQKESIEASQKLQKESIQANWELQNQAISASDQRAIYA